MKENLKGKAIVHQEERVCMLKKYKAVFFDVGGTLIRVHPSVGEV